MNSYILQYEGKSDKWAYVKIDPVKTEVKNEGVKTEKNVNNEQGSRREEYSEKNDKNVSIKNNKTN